MKSYLIPLSLAAVATILCALVYAAVQQDLRQTANDPQIQVAEDLASLLASGRLVNPNITDKVDIAASLKTFVMVYDQNGNLVSGSAFLDDAAPQIPKGIFDSVKANGEDRVTWEPKPGVRAAIVVVPYESSTVSGFVVAGRSLREVEKRENKTMLFSSAAWVAAMLAILFFAWLPKKMDMSQTHQHEL